MRYMIAMLLIAGTAQAAYLEKADVTIRDGVNLDAFSRLRVGEPYSIFDSKQIAGKDTTLYFSEYTNGTGTATYDQSKAAVILGVGANGVATRATRQRFNYQPGKGQLVFLTWRTDNTTGTTARIGYYNNAYTNTTTVLDGLYFELKDGTSYVCRANNGTITRVAQADWNIDKLDGTGSSGETITDWTKSFIGFIQFQWLGVGRVVMGYDLNGLIVPVHQFLHSPTTDSVYMESPNQPVTYHIESDGGTGSLDHICSAVISEGGLEQNGLVFSHIATNTYTVVTGSDRVSMMALRLDTNYPTTTVIVDSIQQMSPSLGASEAYAWELVFNPDNVAGLDWASKAGSTVQVATAPNIATTNAAAVIASGFVSSATKQSDAAPSTSLRLGVDLNGVPDVLMLRITSKGANNDAVHYGITWRELQ